jgi:hypothetical protein
LLLLYQIGGIGRKAATSNDMPAKGGGAPKYHVAFASGFAITLADLMKIG